MTKRLITSALPYVNNVPHLGNIIGCVLSADVYARYCRSMGYETLYICATDEYGTATEKKALDEKLTPKEICDKYHTIHKQVYEAFNLQFDFFGRTSHPEHIEVTQGIFHDLEANGMILEQSSEQSFCVQDNMFLADRLVEGTCPSCGYESARGDQCDSCGKLLQPTELKNPRCQICSHTPITKETKHLYLDLPKLEQKLVAFHESASKKGFWPTNAVTTTKSWVERGLQPRPITRDLRWGVPVPHPGYENKVFYVWFDAPIGYISATRRALPDSWKEWWQNPQQVELFQFMAKDNIPFHTVVFPASLLGTGRNWTMLHHISSIEYLNYENTKFSKSRGIGVFGTDVLDLLAEVPIDLWRFYLLYNRPEKSDTNFSWDGFWEDVNSTFIDNIGNLLNRVMVFFHKNYPGETLQANLTPREERFMAEVNQMTAAVRQMMEQVQLRDALRGIMGIGKMGNKFFHDSEPWKLIKEDPASTKALLVALAQSLREIGILLSPFMPETAARILAMLGESGKEYRHLGDFASMGQHGPAQPEILFKKLEKKQFEAYKERYAGKQQEAPQEATKDLSTAWAQLEIKVGKIVEIAPHPEADKLFVEKVDLGQGDLRTIVSGLVKFYSAEELKGQKVLVASNLASANLRGVLSQGMVLAVEKGKKLEVPFVEGELGEQVFLQGQSPVVAPKEISIDDFFACELTVENHQIRLGEQALCLSTGPIRTQVVAQGKVR